MQSAGILRILCRIFDERITRCKAVKSKLLRLLWWLEILAYFCVLTVQSAKSQHRHPFYLSLPYLNASAPNEPLKPETESYCIVLRLPDSVCSPAWVLGCLCSSCAMRLRRNESFQKLIGSVYTEVSGDLALLQQESKLDFSLVLSWHTRRV